MNNCNCIPDNDVVQRLSDIGIVCTCGENQEACATNTCAQHESYCSIFIAAQNDCDQEAITKRPEEIMAVE